MSDFLSLAGKKKKKKKRMVDNNTSPRAAHPELICAAHPKAVQNCLRNTSQ